MSTERSQWGSPQPALAPIVEKREPEWHSLGAVEFSALGDRVLIVEDQFKSGYECQTCSGSGKLHCAICKDGHNRLNPSIVCKNCHGTQQYQCPDCQGKGGTLVVPDMNQRRPTTGVIVSAGEACKVLAVGEKVMFSNFAGMATDISTNTGTVCLRILHETEVLVRVRGHLALRDLKNQTEVSSI